MPVDSLSPEIQQLICRYLANDQAFATLACLAVTCQDYTDPALDALWETQDHLRHLIKTMSEPLDLWALKRQEDSEADEAEDTTDGEDSLYSQEEGGDIELSDLIFIRELQESDWERFNYYAPRIRSLRLFDSGLHVDSSALIRLALYRPLQPMLKRIRRLTIQSITGIYAKFHDLFPLLGESLSEVEILGTGDYFFGGITSTHNFLLTLARTCPKVKRFIGHFASDNNMHYCAHLVEQLIPRWKGLEYFATFGINPSGPIMHELGKLLRLQEWDGEPFSINWEVDSYRNPLPAPLTPPRGGYFTRLRKLSFSDQFQWETLLPVLEAVKGPLQKLSVQTGTRNRIEYHIPVILSPLFVRQFFRVIQRFSHLTDLLLIAPSAVDAQDPDPAMIRNSISLLLQLSKLKHVHLCTPLLSEADDLFLSEIPTSWPNIRSLHLMVPTLISERNQWLEPGELPEYLDLPLKMSLVGLLPVVEGCKFIENLEVSVQCVPMDMSKYQASHGSSTIKQMNFYSSLLQTEHVPSIMRQLARLFPNLQQVGGSPGRRTDQEEAWKRFNDMAKSLFELD